MSLITNGTLSGMAFEEERATGELYFVLPTKAIIKSAWRRGGRSSSGIGSEWRSTLPVFWRREIREGIGTSATYRFPCLIFRLCETLKCRHGVMARLIHLRGALDIGLIRDEANVVAHHEPRLRYLLWVPTLRRQGSSTEAASMGLALPVTRGWILLLSLGESEVTSSG
ncbi:hypothetical protein H5410_035702 [Solanum commersonii]|uniref:Uncharacterized protein n=1 Tax=Solanum commersonii TaxID=4109 RepID=A0A9J5Y5Y5_SOLCO|nr:hypothetical protein H5410_035702 [Solanum commersonii]